MMQQRHLSGASGTPQVLAEGIEDLQVSFACDTGSLGLYNLTAVNGSFGRGNLDDGRQQDEWWNNVPGDVLPWPSPPAFATCPPPFASRWSRARSRRTT